MSALGNELVRETLEGMRKRKRVEAYERSNLRNFIERKWKNYKPDVKNQCKQGAVRAVFCINTNDWCHEYTPTVREVLDALPEEIQEMRRADSKEHGCFVTIHETDNFTGQYEIVFSIHDRVEALIKEGALKEEEEE